MNIHIHIPMRMGITTDHKRAVRFLRSRNLIWVLVIKTLRVDLARGVTQI